MTARKRCNCLSLVLVAAVILLLTAEVMAQAGSMQPVPPRTGKNSVQIAIGGTDNVLLAIVPPRAYTDGTPIPVGTPCTIVIYRSKANGAPGTYTEEVGRADGKVTSPNDLQAWIDVKAHAGPDNPNGDTIYLACTAIVGGIESNRNNQWLTINWYLGGFTVDEYPAGASGAAGAAGAVTPCSNYWGPMEPMTGPSAAPSMAPGIYNIVYAEIPKSPNPAASNPQNWIWKSYGSVTLRGEKRYLLSFGGQSQPTLLEESGLPSGLQSVSPVKNQAIIWSQNQASDKRYAYCLQPSAGTSGSGIKNSIILLFDASGSMGDNNKIDNAKAAAKSFLANQIQADDEVALIVFYDCDNIVVEQPFTTDKSALASKIDAISPYGSTPLYAAISFAKDYMRQNARGQNKKILQFTDGEETCGGGP
jgi:hypothetical protein